jgi:hypothetical protein
MKFNSLIILLLISIQTYSQSNKFEVGFNLGGGISEFRGTSSEESLTSALSMGLQFQYNLSELFSIHSNILYETKGAKLLNYAWQCTNCPKNEAIIQLEYITVPILARFNFGTKSKLFVNAGPYVGYLFNYDWIDNQVDIGLTTGIGGQIPLNKRLVLSLEFRNNFGLVPLTSVNTDLINNRYNNSLFGLIGIAYRIAPNNKE